MVAIKRLKDWMGKMQERWTSCARDEIESEEVCLSLVTTAALFFVCRTMDAPSFYGEVGDVHTLSLWLMTKESGATLSVLVQAIPIICQGISGRRSHPKKISDYRPNTYNIP